MKVAIASGKGGTGKTTVAVNLMYALEDSEPGGVRLVDCDVEEPNAYIFTGGQVLETKQAGILVPEINKDVCIFCGRCAAVCNFQAIVFLKQVPDIMVSEDLCHGCGACSLFCAPRAITEAFRPMGEVRRIYISEKLELIEGRLTVGQAMPTPVLRETKKQAEGHSYTIYDAPPGTSCTMVETIEDADYVVLVTEPTAFGLNDLELAYQAVKQLDKPCGIVINRSDLGDQSVLDFAADQEIDILMEIPFDKHIARAYSEGKILIKEMPQYKDQFLRMAERIKQYEANRHS